MRYQLVSFAAVLAIFAALPSAAQQRTAAPKFRTITIVTEPLTTVWLDGVRYGRTNAEGRLVVRTVSVGAHSLRLRSDGFGEKTQTVTAAQKGELRVQLAKTTDPAELAFQEAERLALIDRSRAAEAYRKAIRLRSDYLEAHIGLARILSEASETDDALAAIAALRRVRPGNAEASAIEGRVHKDAGNEAKAIASFLRAITEGRGFQPEAYTGLGLLYKDRAETAGGSGDFEGETANYAEASKYLRTALKQLAGAPDSAVIYQLLGLIFERQKKYAEAIAVYEEYLSIFPDTPEATSVRSFIVQLKKDLVSHD